MYSDKQKLFLNALNINKDTGSVDCITTVHNCTATIFYGKKNLGLTAIHTYID